MKDKKRTLPWTDKKWVRGLLGYLVYLPMSLLCLAALQMFRDTEMEILSVPAQEVAQHLLLQVFPVLTGVVSMFCRKAKQSILFSLFLVGLLWCVLCYLAGMLFEFFAVLVEDIIVLPLLLFWLITEAGSVGEEILIIFS